MTYEYKYSRIRGRYFSIIPILVKDIQTSALVDSGASISLFRPELAYDLDIDIERGERINLEGIGNRIIAYIHKVPVVVEDYKFTCNIGFSEEYTVSFNILGRDNFFQQFLITFDETKQKLKLELAK